MFISLLGSPRILIDQHPVTGLRRKNCALVYFIAAHREAVTRDQLMALFWPDYERPAAQQILRTMLHDLRKQLGSSVLIEEDRLSLGADVWVDAAKFNDTLAAAEASIPALTPALELYRGEFLDGFTLSDAPDFDDWAASERGYYRSLAIRGYAALGRLYEAKGKLTAALDAVTKGLAIDPLREELQRESLRLHYLNGDRTGAILQYEALRKLLDDELGVPPMPETRALYDAIINDSMPAPQSTSTQLLKPDYSISAQPAQAAAPLLPFTGRSAELERVQTWVSSQKFLLIEGPPGIGKTRLVNEFLSAYRAAPASNRLPVLVLRGVAHELEQGLPYQPVVDAIRGLLAQPEWSQLRANLNLDPVWLAEITRLLPEMLTQFPNLLPPSQTTDESRTWEGIHQFLKSLSRQRRVFLFLDDIQWADGSTLGLVGYLTRRAISLSILLIGTTRSIETHTKLAVMVKSLVHEDHLTLMTLAPLTAADTGLIAKSLSPIHQELLTHWLTFSAEGNPYFLTELVRHAYLTNLLQKEGPLDPSVLASTQILPPTIQNLILSRLIRLSEEAHRVLDLAAVIGRQFDFDLINTILSQSDAILSEETILNALVELQAAVLIQPIGVDRFSFDHSLTMEVVVQDMGELRSMRLHRQIALALEQMHARHIESISGIIAHHYSKGGFPDRAAPFAFRAGLYSAGLAAWMEAIAYYEQALSTEKDVEQQTCILTALGTARFHKGEFTQSTNAFTSAINLARPRNDLVNLEAAYMGLNLSLLPQARYAEAIAAGQDLALTGPPELAVCAHFIWASGLSVESAHPDEAEAHLHEVERLMSEHPAYTGLVTRAHVSYQLAGVVGQQGKSSQAVALYREALDLVRANESSLDLLRQIMLFNNLAYHLNLLGDPSAAEYARAGIQLARERGSTTHMPSLLSTSGEIALSNNDLDEAERFFAEGLTLAEQVPFPERIAGLTANLGLVASKRGQVELARQRLDKALELADRLDNRHLVVRIHCWLAPLLLPDEARARLEKARQIAETSGFHRLIEEIDQIEKEINPV
jgi:DNA-binding SARP family transcriptional activator/Flp pilus assembly protein TadD/energy-coupling factor transporter ATP-binding protein EcfA2